VRGDTKIFYNGVKVVVVFIFGKPMTLLFSSLYG